MSEEDSPHRSIASEYDPNNSIITKVHSRVSSMLSTALSKWFSPNSSLQNDRNSSRNGSLRRRRDDSSGDEDENHGANTPQGRPTDNEPPIKRSRQLLDKKTSTPNFDDYNTYNSPVRSELLNRSVASASSAVAASTRRAMVTKSPRNSSFTTTHSTMTTSRNCHTGFSASTPTSVVSDSRTRKYLELNKSSAGSYDFVSRNSSLLDSSSSNMNNNNVEANKIVIDGNTKQMENQNTIVINEDNSEDEEVLTENVEPKSDSIVGESVKGRRGIHDNILHYKMGNFGPSNKRSRLIETPPTRMSVNVPIMLPRNNVDRLPSNAFRISHARKEFAHQGSHEIVEDEEENEIDEITIPIEEGNEDENLNGVNDTPSESEGSVNSFMGRPGSRAGGRRSVSAARMFSSQPCNTGINFHSHLQTEKSLFSDKNLSKSVLSNSTVSLNSWTRRPSFNASLYGSTSALSDSRLMNIKSPFYNGKTIYGGSSSYTRNAHRVPKALNVPVQIRPSSSASNVSSSNTSTTDMSNTAKRILDLLNQVEKTPLKDALKMAINKTQKPTKAFDHQLKLNQSIRYLIKTPYSRTENNNRELNKSTLQNELQIPTMPQLFQLKKFQNNTEQFRKVANESNSLLNNKVEYQLPNDQSSNDNGSNGNNKYTSKIKNKISSIRAGKDKSSLNDYAPMPEVNLPNISLPVMKTIPKIDIGFPMPTSDRLVNSSTRTPAFKLTPTATSTITSSSLPMPQDSSLLVSTIKSQFKPITTASNNNVFVASDNTNTYKFSSPVKVLAPKNLANITPINNFTFSQPKTVNVESETSKILTNAPIGGSSFKFSSAMVSKETKIINEPETNADKFSPQLKTGSVMDALKGYSLTSSSQAILNENIKPAASPITSSSSISASDNPLAKLMASQKGKWECDMCMVRNDTDKTRCASCETPRPSAKPQQTSVAQFTNMTAFAKPDDLMKKIVAQQNSSKWECNSCMTRNDSSNNKCACCGTPNSKSSDKTMNIVTAAPTTQSDDFMKKIAAEQSSTKWECSTCLTRNDSIRNKCVCCEQAKPGTSTESVPKFSFGVNPTTPPKYTFGIPVVVPLTGAPTTLTTSIVAVSTSSSFVFGGSAGKATTVDTNTATASKTTYTFGIQPLTDKIQSTTKSASSTGFAFGTSLKPNDTIDAPDKKSFVFGNQITSLSANSSPGTSTSNNSISVPKPIVTKEETNIPISTAVPPIALFGSPLSSLSSLSNTSTVLQANKPIPSVFGSIGAATPPVLFGTASPISPVKKSDTDDAKAKPIMGGFAFGGTSTLPKSISATTLLFGAPLSVPNTITTTANTTATFGTGTSPSTMPVFGNPVPTTTTTQLSAPTMTPGFAFGTQQALGKEDTPKVFGHFSTPPKSTEAIFGPVTPNQPTLAAASTAVPLFGSATQTSTFSFSSQTAKTTASSIPSATPFTFGANASASNTTVTPSPVFGTGFAQSQTTPTASPFGGVEASNMQSKYPVFGNFAPVVSTPSTVSGFGTQSTSNTFGGSGASTTTNLFGAASATQSQSITTFGTPLGQVNSTPTFGTVTQSPFHDQSSEPAAKKGPGFTSGFDGTTQSQNNYQTAEPFQFQAAQPPSFSVTTPSFHFTSQSQKPQTTQPFTFGTVSAPASNASFTFSAGAAAPESTPFQFGAPQSNNPFTTYPNRGNQQVQRRKVKATRRLVPR